MTRLTRFVAGPIGWAGLALVCGVPLAYAVAMTPEIDSSVLLSARSAKLMLNSLLVALGSAGIACVFGAPVGFAVGGLRSRGEQILACAAAVPFLLPPYASAMAWIEIVGTSGFAAQSAGRSLGWLYSPVGAAWVLGTGYLTIPAAAVVLAVRSGAFSAVAPARLARGGTAVVLRVLLPAARPYLGVAAAVVFLLSLSEFAVPSLLQVAVYPVEIHTEMAVNYDAGRALVLSLPLLFTGSIVLCAIGLRLSRVHAPLGEENRGSSLEPYSPAARTWIAALAWAVIVVTTLPVLVVLVLRTESLDALYEAWSTAGPEMQASAGVGMIGATVATVLAFFILNSTGRRAWRVVAIAIAFAPFLMPGPAVAIALVAAWNHADWRAAVYDGPQILVLACAARFTAISVAVIAASRVSQAREWDEAARVFGVPAWRRLRNIALPAAAPAMVAAWGVVFVLASREADAGVLVAPPGFTTIAVRLLALMHYGPSAVVAGLSLLLIALTIAAAATVAVLVRGTIRWVHGTPERP
jgi:iron(III) transport system permease protein